MNQRIYYKLGSFLLVLISSALIAFIIAPFLEKPHIINEAELDRSAMQKDSFEEELRMNRDLYLRVANSSNPMLTENLKDHCRNGIKEIENALYKEELSPEEQIELRKKLLVIHQKLNENFAESEGL